MKFLDEPVACTPGRKLRELLKFWAINRPPEIQDLEKKYGV